jgi:endonuclease/exonuclease/phosphatase family metal-dependent hydrolase
MSEVSVATWNLHQGMDKRPANMEATWQYLERQIAPTVALVQEADGIPPTSGGSVAERAPTVRYESAVVAYSGHAEQLPPVKTRYGSALFDIKPRVPGNFAAARIVDLPSGESFVAVSLYGIMAPVYAQAGILRAVADLIPLFDAPEFNRRIVLGGDLNAYDQHPTDRVMRERWVAILAMIESLGLVNLVKQTQSQRNPLKGCTCQQEACWHVETFRHRNHPAGQPGYFMTDHMFASPDMAARLTGFEVWNDRSEVWEYSDHCPLVARFNL